MRKTALTVPANEHGCWLTQLWIALCHAHIRPQQQAQKKEKCLLLHPTAARDVAVTGTAMIRRTTASQEYVDTH